MNQHGKRVDRRGSTARGVPSSLAKSPMSTSVPDRGNRPKRVQDHTLPSQSKFGQNPPHQDSPESLSRLASQVHLDPRAKVFQAGTQPVFDVGQKGQLAYLPAFENIPQDGSAQNTPASYSYEQSSPSPQFSFDSSQADPSEHYLSSSPIAFGRGTDPYVSPELEAQFLLELKQIRDDIPPNASLERQILNRKNADLTGEPRFNKLSSILDIFLEQEKLNINNAHRLLSARGWKQVAPQLIDRELYDTERAKKEFLKVCKRIRKTAPNLVDLPPSSEMLFCMEVESRINLHFVRAQGLELRKQLRNAQRRLMQQHEKVQRGRDIFLAEYPEVLRLERELQAGMALQSSLVKNYARSQVDRATQTWDPVEQKTWVEDNVNYQQANSHSDAHASRPLQQSNLNVVARPGEPCFSYAPAHQAES